MPNPKASAKLVRLRSDRETDCSHWGLGPGWMKLEADTTEEEVFAQRDSVALLQALLRQGEAKHGESWWKAWVQVRRGSTSPDPESFRLLQSVVTWSSELFQAEQHLG